MESIKIHRVEEILRDAMKGKLDQPLSQDDLLQLQLLSKDNFEHRCLSGVEFFLVKDLLWRNKKGSRPARAGALDLLLFDRPKLIRDPQFCALYPLIEQLREKKFTPEEVRSMMCSEAAPFDPKAWKISPCDYKGTELQWKPCYLEKLLSRPVPCDIKDLFEAEQSGQSAAGETVFSKAYDVSVRFPELTVVLSHLTRTLSPETSIRVGGTLYVNIDKDQQSQFVLSLAELQTQYHDWKFYHNQLVPIQYLFYDVTVRQVYAKPEYDVPHAACLFVDNLRKTCEMFDPHGDTADYAPYEDVVKFLAEKIKIPSGYKLLAPAELCDRRRWSWQGRWPRCFYYTMLYFILRVTCSQNPRENILLRVSRLTEEQRDHLLAHTHCLVERAVKEVHYQESEARIASLQGGKTMRKLKRKLEEGQTRLVQKQLKQMHKHPERMYRIETKKKFDLQKDCFRVWLADSDNTMIALPLLKTKCIQQDEKQYEIDMKKIVSLLDVVIRQIEFYSNSSQQIFPLRQIEVVLQTPAQKSLVLGTIDLSSTRADLDRLARTMAAVLHKQRTQPPPIDPLTVVPSSPVRPTQMQKQKQMQMQMSTRYYFEFPSQYPPFALHRHIIVYLDWKPKMGLSQDVLKDVEALNFPQRLISMEGKIVPETTLLIAI